MRKKNWKNENFSYYQYTIQWLWEDSILGPSPMYWKISLSQISILQIHVPTYQGGEGIKRCVSHTEINGNYTWKNTWENHGILSLQKR